MMPRRLHVATSASEVFFAPALGPFFSVPDASSLTSVCVMGTENSCSH